MYMKFQLRSRTRRGFTLVELMVAMALTIFIMVILSEAFTKGLETFSGLKSIGDMNENLRSAALVLRNDLNQDHFTGKRRISDPFWNQPAMQDQPREGGITLGRTALSTTLGNDVDGLPVMQTANGLLNFVVKRRGNRPEDFFTAPCHANLNAAGLRTNFFNQPADGQQRNPGANPNLFTSQWAEVAYYLEKTGTTIEPMNPASTLGGSDIFALYRKQYLVVPDPSALNTTSRVPVNAVAGYEHIACFPDPADPTVLFFPTPADLTQAAAFTAFNAGNGAAFPSTNAGGQDSRGRSLVIPSVLAFHVEVLLPGQPDFMEVPAGSFPVKALRITIRVYDQGTQQARQMTIIQDL